MDTIKSHLTTFDDNLDNLILEYSYTTKNDTKRYNIYNQNVKYPLHKIWLLTPKLKLIRKSSTIKRNDMEYYLFTMALNDHDPEIKKFHDLIINLENYITNKLNQDELLSLKSCIKTDENSINTITFSLPTKHNINIYNTEHKITSLENINHNDCIVMYLELNTVWENSDKYGMNWQILQMKVYPEFNFKSCLFDDIIIPLEDKTIPSPPLFNIPPPPSSLPSSLMKSPKQKNHDDSSQHGSFVPSVEQLLSIKNILKPVNPPKPVIKQVTKTTTNNPIKKKKKKLNGQNVKKQPKNDIIE